MKIHVYVFVILIVIARLAFAANYCGESYSDSFKCETACPAGIDSECPGSETCYADVSCPDDSDDSDAPLSGFAEKVVDKAKAEHGNYGGLEECGSASLSARIGEYWDALGLSYDGCDTDVPWSAAFISYMVRVAGGGDRFKYSAGHRVYIKSAFAGGKGLYDSVEDIDSAAIGGGDLVCAGRGSVADWTYSDFINWYEGGAEQKIPTHCDIVIATSGSSFEVIGGNIGNTVTQRDRSKSDYAVLLPVTSS